MEIIHGEITTKKIVKNVWVAKCEVTKPVKATVEQKGVSEQDAINKLKKFLTGSDEQKNSIANIDNQ